MVGKSYQKHFMNLKRGRGTLPTGLQRVKKTLLACGVPSEAAENEGLLCRVGEFFGFQRHLLDFKSILVHVDPVSVLYHICVYVCICYSYFFT